MTSHEQLGGGCSAAAILDGQCVDTTMGLTPNEGMAMAERSGSIDPGLLLALMRNDALSPDEVEDLLNLESGIKGLTGGQTGDIDEAHELALAGDANAARAVAVYVHRACREIAAVSISLPRLESPLAAGRSAGRKSRLPTADRSVYLPERVLL